MHVLLGLMEAGKEDFKVLFIPILIAGLFFRKIMLPKRKIIERIPTLLVKSLRT